MFIIKIIKSILRPLAVKVPHYWSQKCWSQEGEDMILGRIFEHQKTGIYIDIGAFHPYRFSNTYKFYRIGWRGINIEPNAENFKLFKIHRAKDINLNVGVGEEGSELSYAMYQEPAENTFDEGRVRALLALGKEPVSRKKIKIKTLDSILEENKVSRRIDFISMDCEGFEEQILKGFTKISFYEPRVILVEQLNTLIDQRTFVSEFMIKHGYRLFAKTANTFFYVLNKDSASLHKIGHF
jgi:FkbM family methyltransferase